MLTIPILQNGTQPPPLVHTTKYQTGRVFNPEIFNYLWVCFTDNLLSASFLVIAIIIVIVIAIAVALAKARELTSIS